MYFGVTKNISGGGGKLNHINLFYFKNVITLCMQIQEKIKISAEIRQSYRNAIMVINLQNHHCNHLDCILTNSKRSIFRYLKNKVWISQHIIQ